MVWKLHWTSVAALTAALVTVAMVDVNSARAAGNWRTDYQQARSDAHRDGKLLLLHFHAKWCGPCRQMDRDVLGSPALGQALGENIIAVKIDSDLHPQLVGELGIRSLPSDVFMSPEGTVLHRTSGYQQPGSYLQMVSGMSAKFVRQRPVVVKREPEPARPPVSRQPEVRPEVMARVEQELPREFTEEIPTTDSDDSIGLRGFCPVTLWNSREWKAGRAEYAATYRGVTYHMLSAVELAEFQKDPRRFAPRLMGFDPVVMALKNQAVAGSTTYGAFYDGELYLFENAESRRQFKLDPDRYSKIRQVQRPKTDSQLR